MDRFNLLPTEQPRVQVTGCNQDSDVQKKLNKCLEDHLSESASSSAGTGRGILVTLSPSGYLRTVLQ